jgi:HlyD family type I secretion membrane fusion protein
MSATEDRIEGQGSARAMGVRRPLLFAMTLVVAFTGGFGAWSSMAPLESAAIAPGIVVVDTNRKAVQHLEGGVVARLLAHEGATVTAGQLLVLLDQTQARSAVDRLRAQLMASLALRARLKAERDQLAEITFPSELTANAGDLAVADLIRAERHVFETRREQIEGQIRILRQRNTQVDEEIRGLVDEIKAEDLQLKLIREEMADVETLVKKGLERKPRLLALQRQAASIEGLRAQNVARIARNRQTTGENDLRVLDLKAQYLSESVQKLRDEEARIFETREKLRAAEDVLQRTEIRAPVAGRVQSLKVFTVGGVVPPRETIMEIVPGEEKLIVEARLSTADIDKVQAGLPVQLRFTAFNQRSTPSLDGRVLNVSADRMTEQQSGAAFYLVRVTVEQGTSLPAGLSLYPGMPVEVTVRTGSQTLLGYLTRPILDSLHRALRED